MTSFFTEKLAGQDVSDFHLFVTTHPYMAELGLGTFTTGTLYNWWNERTADGFYLNRLAINDSREKENLREPPNRLDKLLGISGGTEFFWNGWKPSEEYQNAGRYLKQDLSEYDTGYGGQNPWFFDSALKRVRVEDIPIEAFNDPSYQVIGGTIDDSLNFNATYAESIASNGGGLDETSVLFGLTPMYDIVNLNRYMSSFEDFYPRSLWDKDEATIGGNNTEFLFAAHELLTEIKASKGGPYIEWSGEVTFYTNENQGTVNCAITEWVPFRLYLFDESTSQGSNKSITVKNFTYVAPKRDVTGRLFGDRTDGGYTDFNPNSEASKGAGEMDMSYNTVTKKWESGSPTLFAKMVTGLSVPQSMPSVTQLLEANIQEALDSDNFEGVKVIPASGTAMPIRPQNGNYLQWQPNYLEPDDVRCETESIEKETLTVWNFNTRRSYTSDEEVLLTKIDGLWHVSDPGGTYEPTGDGVTSSVGKWGEFSYLMTNSDYFFTEENGSRFTPRDAELSFHKSYYKEDAVNGGAEGFNYTSSGGYDNQIPFDTKDITPISLVHGFAQTTSFDYLDRKLFGIRDKEGVYGAADDLCSISSTLGTENSAGHVIPKPNPDFALRNAAHCGVFFGCVFPEGYLGVDDYLGSRDWNVKVKTSGTNNIVDGTKYIYDEGNNSNQSIFDADNSTDDRNNVRRPTRDVDPFDAPSWIRANNTYSSNLFASHVDDGDKLFRHIPADVMLNASPEGQFGSPLYPVHRFKSFHDATRAPTGIQLDAQNAFLKAIWLGKDGLASVAFDESDSAFDFRPLARNHIMFRPLKMEGYVQFGNKMCDPASDLKVQDRSKVISHNDRVGFSVEAHRTQFDSKRPATQYFEIRETGHAPDFWTEYGMKWGGEVENRPNYRFLHDYSYWAQEDRVGSDGAMKWARKNDSDMDTLPKNWRGAAAFGVITTSTTVSANTIIEFDTTNQYGFGAAANGNFILASRGYENQDKTWGVSIADQTYRQENITDLSVRIFQQHPKEQTLFDPRTFAVHHFNPDVRYSFDEFLQDNGDTVPLSPIRNLGSQDRIPGTDANGNPIFYQYNFPIPSSTVDFQEISRFAHHIDETFNGGADLHDDGGEYPAVAVPTGNYIFSDGTYDGAEFQPPVIASKFWLVNTDRVGKLLPFRYAKRDAGVPCSVGETVNIDTGVSTELSANLPADGSPVLDIKDKMVVKNQGQDYEPGDKVGSSSHGAVFSVATIGDGGAIASLKCLNPGTGINAASVAATGDVFKPESSGPIQLSTIDTANGTGFSAYYATARVYNTFNIDPKPYIMKRDSEEIVRLASEKVQPGGPFKSQIIAESEAFVDEERQVSFTLDPATYSSNKQYDLFFHFHNDISMTWLASNQEFHGGLLNNSEASEQFISLRINPR